MVFTLHFTLREPKTACVLRLFLVKSCSYSLEVGTSFLRAMTCERKPLRNCATFYASIIRRALNVYLS